MFVRTTKMRLQIIFLPLIAATLQAPQSANAQSTYQNPVDKKTYVTAGQFKTYQSDTTRDTRGQRVTTAGVILLTGEPQLKERVKVEDLAGYIRAAEASAYAELTKNKKAMVALVQFNCQPGACEIQLASQGEATEATLQALYKSLSRLPALKATGEVIFQLKFDVGA